MMLKNNYLLIVLSAILVGISQQPVSLGFLSWFSLIPFIVVLLRQKLYKDIFIFSLLWGLVYHFIVLYWIATNIGTIKLFAIISMIASVLIMTISTILICLLWFRIQFFFPKYKLILFATIWVSIEFIRSYGVLGFPWVSLANSQLDYFLLIQNAEITGIYGITFWILMVNVLIYQILFKNKNYRFIANSTLIFLFPWLFGYLLYQNSANNVIDDTHTISISLLQPNINLITKRDYSKKDYTIEKLFEESNKAINKGSILIIWPESAIPFHHLQHKDDREFIINQLLKKSQSYLLTGNIINDKTDTYNSSILLNNEGIKGIYNKRQLVPIAEYVPLSKYFPSLSEINLGQANFSQGLEDKIFTINGISFTSMICFESTFPEINRRHVDMGADALVYLVNDGWYETPPEPQQHARQAIYRAIENRRPVIRCANTGISMVVNRLGIVEEKLELNQSGMINTTINKNNNKTFYTRFGNVFALILLIISSFFFVGTFKK